MNISPTLCLRHISRLLPALIAFALLLPVTLRGQQLDDRATGRTYVIAYPDTVTNAFDTRYPNRMQDKIYAYIYSAVDNNKITVSGNGYNRVLTGKAGKFEILELTDPTFKAPQPIVTETGKVSKNTFRIEAQQPVVVYCYMVTTFGAEAWTPIPVEGWGTDYYAAALPGEAVYDIPVGTYPVNFYSKPKMAPAEILVIAAEDNTVVTFAPTGTLRDSARIDTVRLNRNEAFQIQSHVDTAASATRATQPDLGGTRIRSNKPIGVLSGNTRGMVFDEVSGLAKNSVRNMMMEWMAPVEQFGTEFVYMPTMDDRRPKGLPGEDLAEKRNSELVRIYGRSGTTVLQLDPVTGAPTYSDIDSVRHFREIRVGVPVAHYFSTTEPAEAFMNTTAVVKFLGTAGSGNDIGAKYDGWGTYSVAMTPREQWVSSAPYFAPIHPSNMDHKMNIVADTVSAKNIFWGPAGQKPTNRVRLNTPIKGTDLIWGDISVPAGLDLWVAGWDSVNARPDTSVRFSGFVYGLFKGHEEYRGGNWEFGEYEEYLAVAYAYPLAPSRTVLTTGDSLVFEITNDCADFMRIKLQAVNENPVGLRTIFLDSINNAKLVFVDPANPADIIAKSKAEFRVVPINPLKNASGVVVIKDRTNKEWRIPFSYEAEYLDGLPKNPAVLDFGEVTLNQTATRTITVTNPLSKPVTIEKLRWVGGVQQFRIVEPTIPPTITLQPGGSLKIKVEITPTVENRLYEDSLKIKLTCTELAVKVRAETPSPCVFIEDLNFGRLNPGESQTLDLRICNNGRAFVVFDNPNGNDVVEWIDQHFSISEADKQAVKNAALGANECVTIRVTFASNDTGTVTTTAKFFDNTKDEECKDYSVWTATVQSSLSVDASSGNATALRRIDPNPLHGETRIEFSLASASDATVEIYDATGTRIATLADGRLAAGVHTVRWNAADVPAGVYYCRLTAGATSVTRPVVVVR